MDRNIVKLTCKELGFTYKELGEAIGYSGDSLKNIASKEEVSISITKAIELYKKNIELENLLLHEQLMIGDTVALKSNSHIKMSVTNVSDTDAECIWFDVENKLQKNTISRVVLKKE